VAMSVKAQKVLGVAKNIIFWVAFVLMIAAIALTAMSMLGGLDFRTIVSGSMEPEIPVGSVVVIQPVRDDDIRIGDVITYQSTGDLSVTHKVVGYDLPNNALITHGIANADGVNEITPYSRVIGRVVFHVPYIGRALLFLSTSRGKIIAATVLIALFIISVALESLRGGEEDGGDEEDGSNSPKPPKRIRGSQKQHDDAGGQQQPSLGSWLNDTIE
jgi:signal peptidase